MTLDQLFKNIVSSSRGSWHTITCWGVGSGPSYRSQLKTGRTMEGANNQDVESASSHHVVASFKEDLSITMALGLTANPDFKEAWANIFHNPHASTHHVDIFYNGAMVYRDSYVLVDGGKAKLPMPKRAMLVPKSYYCFVRLLDNLGGYASRFETYFNKSDLQVVDTPWPEF